MKISFNNRYFPVGLLLLLSTLAIGCRSEVELLPVPEPALDALEPTVVRQIEAARAATAGDARGSAFGELGALYHAYQFVDAAEACYVNAGRLRPDDLRWDYYLARLHRSNGRLDDAARSIERVLSRIDSDEVSPTQRLAVIVFAGELAFDRQRLTDAQSLFERALGADPRCVAALIGLGRIAEAGDDVDESVRRFEQALALAPDAGTVHYMLGRAYQAAGDQQAAERHLAQSVTDVRSDLGPADPLMEAIVRLKAGSNTLRQRGDVAFQAGRYAVAVERYRQALAAEPDDAVARANLGAALTMTGDRAAATEQFKRALELDPDKVAAHFGLGVLYAGDGRDADAIEHYRAILRLDAGNSKAHFNLANALSRSGRDDEALAHYRSVIEADPANASARMGEAAALIRLQRFGSALTQLDRGHAAIPGDTGVASMLARLLVTCPDDAVRDGARGLELAERLVTRESTLEHVEVMAMAHAELGEFDRALEWQRAAIEAARGAGRADLVARLEGQRARYERGEPCRVPLAESRLRVATADD